MGMAMAGRRWRRGALCAASVLGVLLTGAASGAAAASVLVVPGGTLEATREDDGTTTLDLDVTNLTDRDLTVAIDPRGSRCGRSGAKVVTASTVTEVSFTLHCDGGAENRTADVVATSRTGPATEVGRVPVTFTVGEAPDSDWSTLSWMLLGIPLALIGVVPPFLIWRGNPLGNPKPGAGAPVHRPARTPGIGDRLPGITSDWSFKDNWASNVGLAAALLTGVFATDDPLDAVLGDDASGQAGVITVAAALAAALIGAAPLFLVILKRRWDVDRGLAKDNTVAGVLVASALVLAATTGLIATVVAVVGSLAAVLLGVVAVAVLLVYAWKSIPQTLALGWQPTPPADDGTAERAPLSAML
jgi:hypothetical protein